MFFSSLDLQNKQINKLCLSCVKIVYLSSCVVVSPAIQNGTNLAAIISTSSLLDGDEMVTEVEANVMVSDESVAITDSIQQSIHQELKSVTVISTSSSFDDLPSIVNECTSSSRCHQVIVSSIHLRN